MGNAKQSEVPRGAAVGSEAQIDRLYFNACIGIAAMFAPAAMILGAGLALYLTR